MNIHIKITNSLLQDIHSDLDRIHSFAAERVGFLQAKIGNHSRDNLLILPYSYWSVPDEYYTNNPWVGAEINSEAIRTALQKTLDSGDSILHVHKHAFTGIPHPSNTDMETYNRLIPSFCAATSNKPHGYLLLNQDGCSSSMILPQQKVFTKVAKISIVGFPMKFIV